MTQDTEQYYLIAGLDTDNSDYIWSNSSLISLLDVDEDRLAVYRPISSLSDDLDEMLKALESIMPSKGSKHATVWVNYLHAEQSDLISQVRL